ncbi:MAG: ATP-binding protein [Clostridiales bacterium]|nr:ATP-binding protein [Clostridiales bacterium]
MKYSRELIAQTDALLAERRRAAQERLDRRRDWLYGRIPELGEVERLQAEGLRRMAEAVARGAPSAAISALLLEAQALQDRRAGLLLQHGVPEDALRLQYECPLCEDRGFVEGRPCGCYDRALRRMAYENSPMGAALRDKTFDNFSLGHYDDRPLERGGSARAMMEVNLRRCRRFAETFEQGPRSLLLQGGCGLGKTHLSAAIGNALAARGHEVVYETASALFAALEREKFGRGQGEDTGRYTTCSLLMIDDLGSEFVSPFVLSALFTVLNTRIINGLRMVLSTNFTLAELEQVYTQKILSRIMGEFEVLRFVGTDIRVKLAAEPRP